MVRDARCGSALQQNRRDNSRLIRPRLPEKAAFRGRHQPILIAGAAVTGMRCAPPAVRKTCRNYQDNQKCEPTARRVEKSFRSFFPTGYRQTEQAKNPSTTHTNQRKSKGGADPERNRQRKAEKKKRREAGKPDIEAGNPAATLPASGAGAVARARESKTTLPKEKRTKTSSAKTMIGTAAMVARTAVHPLWEIAPQIQSTSALSLRETAAPLAKCDAPNSRKSGRCSAFDTLM